MNEVMKAAMNRIQLEAASVASNWSKWSKS